MEALKDILSPLGMRTNALQDTLVKDIKLVVFGGTVETARRASVSAWNNFVDSFFLTAHFSEEEYPYDWLMHWLSKQPAWGRSRESDITTESASQSGLSQSTAGDLDEEDEDVDGLIHGRRKRRVTLTPSPDTTQTIYFRGHWLRITRTKRCPDNNHGSSLKISVVTRNNNIIKKLVSEAKEEYEKDMEPEGGGILDLTWCENEHPVEGYYRKDEPPDRLSRILHKLRKLGSGWASFSRPPPPDKDHNDSDQTVIKNINIYNYNTVNSHNNTSHVDSSHDNVYNTNSGSGSLNNNSGPGTTYSTVQNNTPGPCHAHMHMQNLNNMGYVLSWLPSYIWNGWMWILQWHPCYWPWFS